MLDDANPNKPAEFRTHSAQRICVPASPRYILFAGVNGAGKSTLYRSEMWIEEDGDLGLPRVNPDEIIREQGWDWANEAHQLAAGKIARNSIESFLQSLASFDQETTLAGKTIVRNIKRASQLGYDVRINYVGVESPDIAISRVEHRVALGGHDIEPKSVMRRYTASQRNLIEVFPYCKTVSFYDNTDVLNLVAYVDQDTIIDFYHTYPRVNWYKGILAELQKLLRP